MEYTIRSDASTGRRIRTSDLMNVNMRPALPPKESKLSIVTFSFILSVFLIKLSVNV